MDAPMGVNHLRIELHKPGYVISGISQHLDFHSWGCMAIYVSDRKAREEKLDA